MPYFSLKERAPSDSEAEDGRSYGSYLELAKWPKLEQASGHLSPTSSNDNGGSAGSPASATKPAKQPPDWHALLFGGSERYCDEIPARLEMDTYFESCKLAEDAALNFVVKTDFPILGCLRDSKQSCVNPALKNIPLKMSDTKEELIALVMMLDFLSCCCQEGSLFSLYNRCKEERKRHHLGQLDGCIRSALDRVTSLRFRTDQLKSVEQLVAASIKRMPSSLGMIYFSSQAALKRKITTFEMEEQNRKENSVYHFDDELLSPFQKKGKLSTVTATSKNWATLDFRELLRSPSRTGLDQSGQYSSTPKSAKSSSISSEPISSPLSSVASSDSSPFRAQTSSSEALDSDSSRGAAWLFSMDSSSSESLNLKLETDSYSSDDSLPDIPIVLAKEPVSVPNKFWRKMPEGNSKTNRGKVLPKYSASYSDKSYSGLQGKTNQSSTSTYTPKSPYKSKLATWNTKYVSPSKTTTSSSSSSSSNIKNQATSKVPHSPVKFAKNLSSVKIPLQSSSLPTSSSSNLKKNCKCGKCQMRRYLVQKKNC